MRATVCCSESSPCILPWNRGCERRRAPNLVSFHPCLGTICSIGYLWQWCGIEPRRAGSTVPDRHHASVSLRGEEDSGLSCNAHERRLQRNERCPSPYRASQFLLLLALHHRLPLALSKGFTSHHIHFAFFEWILAVDLLVAFWFHAFEHAVFAIDQRGHARGISLLVDALGTFLLGLLDTRFEPSRDAFGLLGRRHCSIFQAWHLHHRQDEHHRHPKALHRRRRLLRYAIPTWNGPTSRWARFSREVVQRKTNTRVN
mmetsp:Transcript_4661/g.29452  ORF Transcript_4661/g.29452 Transcript_4661/m.29452 type:complete len:258 (-) Transcript_4661:101-874(-)